MRRLGACLLTATALALPTTATASPSTAAAPVPTCQGERATHVGAPGKEVTGTTGRDVVVTNGAELTDTGAGDDLVCITGRLSREDVRQVVVVTGAGDDIVLSRALAPAGDPPRHALVRVLLGAGDDQFVGDTVAEHVQDPSGTTDLRMGGGRDAVEIGTNLHGHEQPLDGTVDLGDGGGSLLVSPGVHPDTELDGGAGSTLLPTSGFDPGTVWDFDLPGGRVAADGVDRFRLTGTFDRVKWRYLRPDAVARGTYPVGTFLGTDRAEILIAGRIGTADLGGGDDVLQVTSASRIDLGAGDDVVALAGAQRDLPVVSGGSGRDELSLATPDDVDVDVPGGVVTRYRDYDDREPPVVLRFDGFESYRVSATRLRLLGTDGPDVLTARGCRVTVHGRGGDDTIAVEQRNCDYDDFVNEYIWTVSGGDGDDVITAERDYFRTNPRVLLDARFDGGAGDDQITAPDTLRGGSGDDVLRGSALADRLIGGPGNDTMHGLVGNDVLLGGPGDDFAHGGPGRDRCDAERRVSCER